MYMLMKRADQPETTVRRLPGLLCTTDYVYSFLCMQSVIAKGMLNNLQEHGNLVPVIINFSAQTSSGRTQEIIEGKLEKKRKTILGELYQYTCTNTCDPTLNTLLNVLCVIIRLIN